MDFADADNPAAPKICLELCSEIRSQLSKDLFRVQYVDWEQETFSTKSTVLNKTPLFFS
jgi:hypothetical protein